jgi:flagellar assembly factor FliW
MSTICIQGTELSYGESDIITFAEGMIGLPHLRRMVVISQPEIEPFLWLASLDDPSVVFLVIEPRGVFPDYAPQVPDAVRAALGLAQDESPLLLTIALIAAEWTESTVNLRAPLMVAAKTMRAAQIVLSDNTYRVDQLLPFPSTDSVAVAG